LERETGRLEARGPREGKSTLEACGPREGKKSRLEACGPRKDGPRERAPGES